jgi:hypothetical protein
MVESFLLADCAVGGRGPSRGGIDADTFGLPREQEDFAARNSTFLEVLPTLTRRIDEILATRTVHPDPRFEGESDEVWQSRLIAQRLVFFLGRLAAEDFMEILLQCANGYGMSGLRLLRSMFEGVVTSLFVGRHPDQAKAFMGNTPFTSENSSRLPRPQVLTSRRSSLQRSRRRSRRSTLRRERHTV